MKRKIIKIDEEKCNGCGKCTTVCAEAALEIVDGKAKLIEEFLCDGMGACLDVCPVGALQVIEEDSEEYDVKKTYNHVKEKRGEEAAKKVHGIEKDGNKIDDNKPMACGCPGTMMKDYRKKEPLQSQQDACAKSQLSQWPIQLKLLTTQAPYFEDADLVISADCVPFAFANFHQKFLSGKILIMFCPKLDRDLDEYVEKLTEIFKTQNIKSITIVHMEVPCCSGVENVVADALKKSGMNILMKDYTISIQGEII